MTDRPNLYTTDFEYEEDPPGYHGGAVELSRALQAKELAVKLFELPPAQSLCPYHYEYVEEWLMLIAGELDLRTPEGVERLGTGTVACFPAGPDGAHKVTTPADATEPARFVMFSSAHEPAVSVYPDSDKIGVWVPGGAANVMLERKSGNVPYFTGETG